MAELFGFKFERIKDDKGSEKFTAPSSNDGTIDVLDVVIAVNLILDNQYNEKLTPEIRIFDNPQTLTYEASIRSKFSKDLYITMSNINRSEFYNIKFQSKPFMLLIWCSAILIALGGFLRLFRNEN